jgi:hypothetical protein
LRKKLESSMWKLIVFWTSLTSLFEFFDADVFPWNFFLILGVHLLSWFELPNCNLFRGYSNTTIRHNGLIIFNWKIYPNRTRNNSDRRIRMNSWEDIPKFRVHNLTP